MDEILQLREFLETQRYHDAMLLIGEMEDMAVHDKLTKIKSYSTILLLHLIKQMVENRTTVSWDLSVENAAEEIADINKHRKASGFYASTEEIAQILEKVYKNALTRASLEAFGGVFSAQDLQKKFEKQAVMNKALQLIADEQAKLL
jgi:hypothetical protein